MGKEIDLFTLNLVKKQKEAIDEIIEEMQKLTKTVKDMNAAQQDLIKVIAAQNERIKKLEKKWRDM